MITRRPLVRILGASVVAVMAWSLTQSVFALRKNHPWHQTTKAAADAAVDGWYINLGISGARAMIEPEQPQNLLVKHVFADTPAASVLQVGDRILGIDGQRFDQPHKFGYGVNVFGYEGPMMDFGNALEAAQASKGGRLRLLILREGKEVERTLALPTNYGSFGPTFPFDCSKSDKIYHELLEYLVRRQRENGSWHGRPHINAFAGLALLGSGDKAYLPAVERAARFCAAQTNDTIAYQGLDCWKYTLYGTFLAEYYLITREEWVLGELDEINRWLHKAQMANGGWGHRPANRPGGNGYGAINILTMQAKMAWALMMRCGLEVDQKQYAATHAFVARGTNDLGYVWYKDGGKNNPAYADMGRTGAAAVAHFVSPVGGEPYLAFARRNARCIGEHPTTYPDTHGSPLLGMAWTALGALPEPAMFRKLLDHNRWHFALSHCHDGTYYYQPNRDNNPQDYAADPRLCASAVTALVLSAKERQLQITGAPPVSLAKNE